MSRSLTTDSVRKCIGLGADGDQSNGKRDAVDRFEEVTNRSVLMKVAIAVFGLGIAGLVLTFLTPDLFSRPNSDGMFLGAGGAAISMGLASFVWARAQFWDIATSTMGGALGAFTLVYLYAFNLGRPDDLAVLDAPGMYVLIALSGVLFAGAILWVIRNARRVDKLPS
jgi:hypothetical protein